MSTPGAAFIENIPGRLCADPTSISSGSYPWGGVPLGEVRDTRLRFRRMNREVTAEEWGGMTTEVVHSGETAYLHAVMRRMDTQLLSRLLLGTAAGAVTGRALIDPKATLDGERAGQIVVPFALYFSPDSDQHLGVLFYRAVPMLPDQSEVTLHTGAPDVGVPVVFVATPDSSHERPFQIGLREDLTL